MFSWNLAEFGTGWW